MGKYSSRDYRGVWLCLLVVLISSACANKKPVVVATPPPVVAPDSEVDTRHEAEVERLTAELSKVRLDLDLAEQQSGETNQHLKSELSRSARQLASLQSDYSVMMAQLSDALDEIARLREGLPSVQSRAFAVSLIADAHVRVDAVDAAGDQEMTRALERAGELLIEADDALREGQFGRACYLAQRAREAIRKNIVPVGNVDPLPAPQDFEVVSASNLRVGPGTEHRRIGSAQPGEHITALAKKGDWFRVQTSSGQLVWIHGSLIRRSEGT